MDRRAILVLVIYAALVLSLATPLYEPFGSGRDDSWALLVLLAAAHVGLGSAIRRAWVLALPVALSIVAFVTGGGEELAWLALLLGAPALILLTAVGIALGRAMRQHSFAIAAGFLVLALVPVIWAAVETTRRGPTLPDSLQSRLPTKLSLGNLCPGAGTSAETERDLRRGAELLIRELGRRATHLVTYTYYDAHSGDEERREITLRELAEEQLKDLEAGGPDCSPELQRRLRRAI
jgi:hypothetical protein